MTPGGKGHSRIKALILWTATISIPATLFLISLEIFVRVKGYERAGDGEHARQPTMHKFDPIVGWRNKEGTYVIPPHAPSESGALVTFLAPGRRKTSPDGVSADSQLVVVGGSFTQGWALSDHETYPWKLQGHFPAVEVLNYGTAGYGTYQSLLLLEQELPRLPSPKIVLYGFFGHHETRNVAPKRWKRMLLRHPSRGHVYVPYATLDESGELVRHPPEAYHPFPLRRLSALVSFLEYRYVKMADRLSSRDDQVRQVTEKLILEMNAVSKANGATLVVVILAAYSQTTGHYIDFLRTHGIQVLDCALPLAPETMTAGGDHPSGEMNTRWADCIRKGIEPSLE